MNKTRRFDDLSELFNFLCREEGSTIHYQSKETIYKQGQPDNRVYRVVEGGLAQSKRNRNGQMTTYQILKPGDIFSTYHLSSSVIEQPCQATALVTSKIQQILRVTFKQYLLQNPQLTLSLADLISEELQSRDQTLEQQIYMTAKERIYAILQDLKPLVKQKENELIDFLTRKELADMAGMTEETATRSLSKLEEEGKITKGQNGVVLR